MRIAITGGPQTGKTTLAATLGAPVIHGDDFIELGWSQSSQALAHAMRTPGPWVAEGVQVPRALRKMLEARPDDCVYVGDAIYDLQAARAAGVDAIGVTWGAGVPEALRARTNPRANAGWRSVSTPCWPKCCRACGASAWRSRSDERPAQVRERARPVGL